MNIEKLMLETLGSAPERKTLGVYSGIALMGSDGALMVDVCRHTGIDLDRRQFRFEVSHPQYGEALRYISSLLIGPLERGDVRPLPQMYLMTL